MNSFLRPGRNISELGLSLIKKNWIRPCVFHIDIQLEKCVKISWKIYCLLRKTYCRSIIWPFKESFHNTWKFQGSNPGRMAMQKSHGLVSVGCTNKYLEKVWVIMSFLNKNSVFHSNDLVSLMLSTYKPTYNGSISYDNNTIYHSRHPSATSYVLSWLYTVGPAYLISKYFVPSSFFSPFHLAFC